MMTRLGIPAPSPPKPRSGAIASGAGSRIRPTASPGTATVTLSLPQKSTLFCADLEANRPALLPALWIRKFESFRSDKAVESWGADSRRGESPAFHRISLAGAGLDSGFFE